MPNQKTRLPYWDNVKGILILLVVLGHMLQLLPGGSDSAVYKLIYLFHMPLFVFCSGFMGSYAPRKILKSLVVPYIVLQLLCCVLTGQTVQLTTPYWMLWYLPALAVWRISIPFLDLCGKKWVCACLLGLVLLGCLAGFDDSIGYFASFSRILVFYPYFAAGYFLKKHGGAPSVLTLPAVPKLCAALTALLCFGLFLWFAPGIRAEWLYGAHSYTAGGYTVFFRALHYAAAAVIGFAVLLFVPKQKTVFSTWGKNSFLLYAAHIAVLPLVPRLIAALHEPAMPLQVMLCVLLSAVFCAAVSAVGTLWHRHRTK